jgi:hypothetical protein
MKTFLDDRHEQINDFGDPDLRFHRVGRGSVERLYPQMLLDSFEEQFDLPPLQKRVRDHLRWNIEEVRQENGTFLLLGIDIDDSPQRLGKTGSGLANEQGNDLIFSHSLGTSGYVDPRGQSRPRSGAFGVHTRIAKGDRVGQRQRVYGEGSGRLV